MADGKAGNVVVGLLLVNTLSLIDNSELVERLYSVFFILSGSCLVSKMFAISTRPCS